MTLCRRLFAIAALVACTLAGTTHAEPPTLDPPSVLTVPDLEGLASAFSPTPIEVPLESLSSGDHQALVKLIQAARLIDGLYLQQVWSGNLAKLASLRGDPSPLGQARLHLFWLYKGPWADLDEHRAFLPFVPPRKPPGANFYPEPMTVAGFETWLAAQPAATAEAAKGFYSVIRPGPKDGYTVVPYSEAYKPELARCAALLREAAALTDNATLKRFLNTRADAFGSNDYYASDVAWMDLDAPLDITIGPYETYNDEWFGYKAAFEAYVNLRDDRETAKLALFGDHLQQLEDHLPEDPRYRVAKLGALAPIRVVNEVFAAGDGAHGITTAAYNLPNDDRVVQEKGSKRVMLKNVQQAKFDRILLPIADRVLSPGDRKYVSFEWFFTHILCHELMHGLGPHQITVGKRATNPRFELKGLYGAIEETKADITGLWALQYMLDHAKEMGLSRVVTVDADAERKLYVTYLASMFRTLRFGSTEAHGRGMAVQMKFLLDRGAVKVTPDGLFEIDFTRIKDAVRDLDTVLLTLEAQGDFAGATKLLEGATLPPTVGAALGKLFDVPVDIDPQFVTADHLSPATSGEP